MKIEIGSKFVLGGNPVMALAIPGAGIIEVKNRDESYPFDHVELNHTQLKHLKNEIEKELSNEKQTTL